MKVAAVATLALAIGWSSVRHAQLPMGPSRINWSGTVFGHRGCRHVPGIPENTLDGFRYAVSRGCGGIECDVRLTKDNEAVVFHDACANGQLRGVPPKKRIDEFTLLELKGIRYTEDPTEQIRLPTLEESVLFCRENNMKMLIEIKEERRPNLCADKVLDLYRRYPDFMYEQTTVLSFQPGVLYYTRQRDSRVATGQIYDGRLLRNWVAGESGEGVPPFWVRCFPTLCDLLLLAVQERVMPWVGGCSMVCPHYRLFSEAARRRWQSRRIALYLWGFEKESQYTTAMRQSGVLVSADDHHEDFATPLAPPNLDIFGDAQREQLRQEEEARKHLRLRK